MSGNDENGFASMSRDADRSAGVGAANDSGSGESLSGSLKSYGLDTERMTEAANEQVSEFQRMVMDEVRARPVRALGWAAAAGLFLGFLAAR
jgi:hypothetical protein